MGLDMYLRKGKRIPKKSEVETIKIFEELDVYTRDLNEIDEKVRKEYGDYIVPDYTYADLYDGQPTYKTQEQVGYWRKANAIHSWFVDNVQEGVDECKDTFVPKEKLEELLKICKTIIEKTTLKKGKIKNGYTYEKDENGELKKVPCMQDGEFVLDPFICEELLPTKEGFFFGSQEYDQWYMEDIKNTIEILENVLKNTDFETEFISYQSSW